MRLTRHARPAHINRWIASRASRSSWCGRDTQNPDFGYRINQSIKADGRPWTPAEFQCITGESVNQFWPDYQTLIRD